MKKLILILILATILVTGCAAGNSFPFRQGPNLQGFSAPAEFDYSQLLSPYAVAEEASIYYGGDCQADRTTGDIYPDPDPFCIVATAQSLIAFVEKQAEDLTPTATTPVPTQVTPSPTQVVPTKTQVPTSTATPKPELTPEPEPTKVHCDKGEGNGGEGCDPGNNPDKGNNDEDDKRPNKK